MGEVRKGKSVLSLKMFETIKKIQSDRQKKEIELLKRQQKNKIKKNFGIPNNY